MPKQKPLITRLRASRTLVREWRRSVYDSCRDRTAATGKDLSPSDAREVARFDTAYQALTEAIKVLAPQTGKVA